MPVPVNVTLLAEAGIPLLGLVSVVMSFVTQKNELLLVNAGVIPVIVEAPTLKVAMPAIQWPVPAKEVFAQVPFAVIVPQV